MNAERTQLPHEILVRLRQERLCRGLDGTPRSKEGQHAKRLTVYSSMSELGKPRHALAGGDSVSQKLSLARGEVR